MDKNENLISITEVPAGPYIIKGEFKMINKEGKESILQGTINSSACINGIFTRRDTHSIFLFYQRVILPQGYVLSLLFPGVPSDETS